jgi:hypothetical protein
VSTADTVLTPCQSYNDLSKTAPPIAKEISVNYVVHELIVINRSAT